MQFMDTHVHLQDFKAKNTTDIVKRAKAVGVDKLVCVSAREDDWPKVAALADEFSDTVIPAFGLHPWYVREATPGWERRLRVLLEHYPSALIGEVGLDRFHDQDYEPQNAFFKAQLSLAKEYARPALIHAVRCREWLEAYWKLLPPKFIFHSFNGRQELLDRILGAGGYVSLSASILYNRNKSTLVPQIPLTRLLLETDGPFQSLYRGEEGLPEFLPDQAAELAALYGLEPEKFAARVYQNSREAVYVG